MCLEWNELWRGEGTGYMAVAASCLYLKDTEKKRHIPAVCGGFRVPF